MDTHRHSAMELHQRKSHKRQQWHMPKGLVADTRPLRGRRRWGGSQGVRLLVLIGLFGLLGWGTAPPQAQDLLQPPSPPPQAPEPSRHATRQVPYGQLPLSFEANQGQTDSQVQFLAHSQGYTLFLTAREAVFNFRTPAAHGQRPTRLVPRTSAVQDTPDTARAVVRMQLLEANPAPQVVGLEDLPDKANYFRSNDPQQWRTNVPTYAKVKYAAVYPGVDLVYYGQSRQLEYDFVVAPGADPGVITLGFEGVDHVDVDAQGDLVLSTASGSLRFQKPVIYQEEDGRRHAIAGSYVRKGPHQVGFQLAAYDMIHPLTIDPVLSYATYLGGSGNDQVQGIAGDAASQAYVTGLTGSPDFPTVHHVPFWGLPPDCTSWREGKERLSRIGSMPPAASGRIKDLVQVTMKLLPSCSRTKGNPCGEVNGEVRGVMPPSLSSYVKGISGSPVLVAGGRALSARLCLRVLLFNRFGGWLATCQREAPPRALKGLGGVLTTRRLYSVISRPSARRCG